MSTSKIVFANTVATLAHGGIRVQIRPGEPWDGADPLVKAYPSMFVDQPPAVRSTTEPGDYKILDEAPVERATRAPGEKRRRTTPSK